MKKILLLFTFCFPLLLSAQLTDDDFESYTVGSFDSQWDPNNWVGWFGNASGTNISDEQANSGLNSLKVGENEDVVALLGVLDQGIYEVSFMQYTPSGNSGYYNLQHNYTNTAGDWMFELYTQEDGMGRVQFNGTAGTFPIVNDQWVENKFTLNFVTAIGEFSYNGVAILNFPIDRDAGNGAQGLNQVNAINFFGGCLQGTTCTPNSYFDDVKVVSVPLPPYNAFILNPAPPSEYTIVPTGFEKPLTLAANVWNVGAEPITNVIVTYTLRDNIGNVVHTETSDPIASIGSTESMTITKETDFILSSSDVYTMDYSVEVDETEDITDDNMTSISVPYIVGDGVYAKDDGVYTGGIGLNNSVINMGQQFDFPAAATIDGFSMSYVGGGLGDNIVGHIYNMTDTGPGDVIASTDPITITSPGGGMEVQIIVDFPEDVDLAPGTYGFMIEQTGATSIGLSTSTSVFTPGTTWASINNGAWDNIENLGASVALSIRPLITSINVGIEDVDYGYVNDITISPNPTSDVININLDLNESHDLKLEAYSSMGQLIQQVDYQNATSGQFQMNLGDYPSGFYFVKIYVDEQVMTQKVMLTK